MYKTSTFHNCLYFTANSSGTYENPQQEEEVGVMKKTNAVERTERKRYEGPLIKTEKEAKELSFNCPTTSRKYCGTPFSPKKG